VRIFRTLLFPFSLLYAAITGLRNYFYDKGWFKSFTFEVPVIAVGNLSVGGTGKTPMIEYLVRLLKEDHRLAVLSRGYGRKTKGFLLAEKESDSEAIGDEPYQYFKKFENIQVAVDEDRVNGVNCLLKMNNPPELVLLDDAFQHRRIQAGLYILLTSYGKLFSDDWILPTGNLREMKSGARRAQVIVVSKCPENLDEPEKKSIASRLRQHEQQEVFFTTITYSDNAIGATGAISLEEIADHRLVLVTGIADPAPLLEFLKSKKIEFEHLNFSDHHRLTSNELGRIESSLKKLPGDKKIILTTEKDFVRNFEASSLPVYYLPIRTRFLNREAHFNKIIQHYVRKNKGNS
jgi:tetraacyldisaccharide 4'-kinase